MPDVNKYPPIPVLPPVATATRSFHYNILANVLKRSPLHLSKLPHETQRDNNDEDLFYLILIKNCLN